MSIVMNQNNNTSQQPKVQLMSLRMRTEIFEGDNFSTLKPVQIPKPVYEPSMSEAKLAFLRVADEPVIRIEDNDEHASFYESEPEILLTDSDEEDLEEVMEDAEVETAIGSDENCTMSDSEVEGDVYDEFSPRPVPVVQASFTPQSLSDVAYNQNKGHMNELNKKFTLAVPSHLQKVYAEDQ